MSAGEVLGRLLDHLDAVRWEGSLLILKMSENEALKILKSAPLAELPGLSDTLDVVLSFLAQYGTVPKLTKPNRYADFDREVSNLLQEMDLLDHQSLPRPEFLLFMINHYFLVPEIGGWDKSVLEELTRVCRKTWVGAPREFKDIYLGNSERPITWAEGYMRRRWRYGCWLTTVEQSRSVAPAHPFLPLAISKSLANKNHEIYVPPKYLRDQ